MRESPSPLRYPGGKTQLYPLVSEIIKANNLLGSAYVEPFVGGAGLALRLLLNGIVSRIIVNDLDIHIYAFWHAVLHRGDELCELILNTPVNRKHWMIQKQIYHCCDSSDLLQLGFATFFLNRTNVSGVLTGGMIGGKDQKGDYKLDARYDKAKLIAKVRAVAERASDIVLFNDDAIEMLKRPEISTMKKGLINFDPPYVNKGATLYKNAFTEEDHRRLATKILCCRKKWIVTYDICPLVEELYQTKRMGRIGVYYSVRNPRLANECLILNDNVRLPEGLRI